MGWFRWAALLLLLAPAACGGDSDPGGSGAAPTATVTVTAPPGPTSTAPRPASVAPSAAPTERAEPSTASVTGPPEITGVTVEETQVSSPTGNIWCSLEFGVECVVQRADYPSIAAQPCEFGDWIDTWFVVGPESGIRGSCHSDTPFGDGRPTPLAYGTTSVVEGGACRSETTGMTCWQTRSRHGFRVSRGSYDLF